MAKKVLHLFPIPLLPTYKIFTDGNRIAFLSYPTYQSGGGVGVGIGVGIGAGGAGIGTISAVKDDSLLACPNGETTGINDNVFHEQCQLITFLNFLLLLSLSLVLLVVILPQFWCPVVNGLVAIAISRCEDL